MIETTTECISNIGNIPLITDWLMVGITFVYTVFTIFIFVANFLSVWHTKKQILQSKEQYQNDARLKMMPHLQFEIGSLMNDYYIKSKALNCDVNGVIYTAKLCVSNVGLGTAKDIKFQWQIDGCNFKLQDCDMRSLCPNTSKSIEFKCETPQKLKDNKIDLVFIFTDLLDNVYMQTLSVEFEQNDFEKIHKLTIHHLEFVKKEEV